MIKKISVLLMALMVSLFLINPASAATLTWEAMVNETFPIGTHRSPGFGDPNNILAISMVTFDGYVYVSNFTVTGTEIWRSANGTDWEQANVDGFGEADPQLCHIRCF